MDDEELFNRWCAGDNTAGNELYTRHYPMVYRFFARKADKEDIADLVQETFLACLRSRDTFRHRSSFKTYLLGIARHTLYGYWRARSRRLNTVDVEEASIEALTTSVGSRIVRHEDHARLLYALQQLPLNLQILFELNYWDDSPDKKPRIEQLAEIFEIEPDTIRSRLWRAKERLRELMADHDNVPSPASADFDAWARALRQRISDEVNDDDGGDEDR